MASGADSAQRRPAKKAEYLVVFHKRSERNLSALSRQLKLGAGDELKGASTAGLQMFERRIPGAARVKMFSRVAVAAVDLTRDEKTALAKEGEVQMIVRNEVRRIPPYFDAGSTALPAGAQVGPGFQPATPIPPDPRSAYLLGFRDAIDMISSRALFQPPAGPGALAAAQASHSWCLDMVGIPPAYARASGKGVKVAVLDTGIDLAHPDFRGAVVEGVNGMSFVNGQSVQDGHGHGTHCCGVVAGPARTAAVGRYGVAPDCHLYVGKVLGDGGSGYDDDIIEGITWAADQGARIISMSLGMARYVNSPYPVQYERLASELLNDGDGMLIIAAAGNESERPSSTAPVGSPACCPSIMAVAAVDLKKLVAWFSCCKMDNIGEVNISAPGVAVVSAFTGGGYRSLSGTSMATPHVSGLAALWLETQPKLKAMDLRNTLTQNVIPASATPEDCGAGIGQAPR